MHDLAELSTEPLTYWRATVRRPSGHLDHNVLLIRHVSAPPFPIPGVGVREWFRDESWNTDVTRDSLTDLVKVHDRNEPPHLAHEWAALTASEQRDLLRWAAHVIREDGRRILRDA